jgi:hypothetical protein
MKGSDASPEAVLFWIIKVMHPPVNLVGLRYAYFLAAQLGLGVDAGDVSFRGPDAGLFVSAFEGSLEALIRGGVVTTEWKGNEECVAISGKMLESVATPELWCKFWEWAAQQDAAKLFLLGRYAFHARYCKERCACPAAVSLDSYAALWQQLLTRFSPRGERRVLLS